MENNSTIKNPVKAIRAKCISCMCGSAKEVTLCGAQKCPLFPFRFGKNPYRSQRTYTAEQKAAMAERMRLAREKIKRESEKKD